LPRDGRLENVYRLQIMNATEKPQHAGEGRLKGRVSGQAGSGPLVLRLVHATQPEKDLVLRVTPLADGTFALPLPALERTRWHVLMENQGGTWSLGGAWNWPAERSVRIGASRL
jgi:hypothetical protein